MLGYTSHGCGMLLIWLSVGIKKSCGNTKMSPSPPASDWSLQIFILRRTVGSPDVHWTRQVSRSPLFDFWGFFFKKNSRLNPWMSFDLFGETALRISKWSAKKVIGGAENVAAAEYDSGSRDSRRGENGRNDRIKWLNGPRNIPFRNIYSEKKREHLHTPPSGAYPAHWPPDSALFTLSKMCSDGFDT